MVVKKWDGENLVFSPRVWGCTGAVPIDPVLPFVFPTCVGVYRGGYSIKNWEKRFPHVCGGVPVMSAKCANFITFSPRVWGCTGLG